MRPKVIVSEIEVPPRRFGRCRSGVVQRRRAVRLDQIEPAADLIAVPREWHNLTQARIEGQESRFIDRFVLVEQHPDRLLRVREPRAERHAAARIYKDGDADALLGGADVIELHRPVVVEHLKIAGRQIRDRPALPVLDDDVEGNAAGSGAKRRPLLLRGNHQASGHHRCERHAEFHF